MDKQFKLVQLTAAYIHTNIGWEYFKAFITSLVEQEQVQPDLALIGFSSSTKRYADRAYQLISNHELSWLQILIFDEKTSQVEAYWKLFQDVRVRKIKDTVPETWFMFADADDLLNSDRTSTTVFALENVYMRSRSAQEKISALSFSHRIENASIDFQPTTTKEVSHLWSRNDPRLKKVGISGHQCEHWNLVVRQHVLGEFLNATNEFMRSLPYADMFLTHFITSYKLKEGATIHISSTNNSWFYFYRQNPEGVLATNHTINNGLVKFDPAIPELVQARKLLNKDFVRTTEWNFMSWFHALSTGPSTMQSLVFTQNHPTDGDLLKHASVTASYIYIFIQNLMMVFPSHYLEALQNVREYMLTFAQLSKPFQLQALLQMKIKK